MTSVQTLQSTNSSLLSPSLAPLPIMSRQTAMPPPPLPLPSSSPNHSGMPSPGMLAPNKYSQRGSMPPPKLPAASCKSSTSSRPSFALSDGSDSNSVFGGPNSSNERIKTPLQDSHQDNVSTLDDVETQFANLMVSSTPRSLTYLTCRKLWRFRLAFASSLGRSDVTSSSRFSCRAKHRTQPFLVRLACPYQPRGSPLPRNLK